MLLRTALRDTVRASARPFERLETREKRDGFFLKKNLSSCEREKKEGKRRLPWKDGKACRARGSASASFSRSGYKALRNNGCAQRRPPPTRPTAYVSGYISDLNFGKAIRTFHNTQIKSYTREPRHTSLNQSQRPHGDSRIFNCRWTVACAAERELSTSREESARDGTFSPNDQQRSLEFVQSPTRDGNDRESLLEKHTGKAKAKELKVTTPSPTQPFVPTLSQIQTERVRAEILSLDARDRAEMRARARLVTERTATTSLSSNGEGGLRVRLDQSAVPQQQPHTLVSRTLARSLLSPRRANRRRREPPRLV